MEQKGVEPLFEESTVFEKGEAGFFCYRIPALVVSTNATVEKVAATTKSPLAVMYDGLSKRIPGETEEAAIRAP